MADDPAESLPPSTGTVDERTLVPIARDRRFVIRLVLLLLLGATAATFVGGYLQQRAAACGRRLIAPGSTVIPPQAPAR